jgi:RNA-directed DNA polymerase
MPVEGRGPTSGTLLKRGRGRRLAKRLKTPEPLRTLQRKLYLKAKREPDFRFYLLYDKVYRADILKHAYRLRRSAGGAAGVDGVGFEDIEAAGVEEWLRALAADLREGKYKPQPVRRVMIPKAGGGERPLGIPTIRDRVVQTAAVLVLEPIFEADFEPNAYGYRPNRSAKDAVKEVAEALRGGESRVVDADLSGYFDTIPHHELMQSVARRISDRKMLHLIKMWLKVPVEEKDEGGRTVLTGGKDSRRGTPQGGVISPLLANIYIHRLLKAWKKFDLERKLGARIINYADDLVIVCRTMAGAKAAHERLEWITKRLGLKLNERKTCVRNAWEEPFDFLGYTFGARWSVQHQRMHLGVGPSKKAVKQARQRIRALLRPGNQGAIEKVVAGVNRRLNGWANYFSIGTLQGPYTAVDRYATELLRQFMVRRHKVSGRGTRRFDRQYLNETLGLVSLNDRRQAATSNAVR